MAMRTFLMTALVAGWLPALTLHAQTLPNPGFEDWTAVGTACQNPESWDTPNGGLALFGLCSVTRETANVQAGSASVRMETVLVPLISLKAPAALSNGTLIVDPSDPFNSTIQGGSPIWGMPDALTGYYDYVPLGGDSLTVRVRLFDITAGDTTLIAEAEHVDDATTSGYVPFTLPITYLVTEDAELAEVLVRSSRNTMNPTVGTVLYVDGFAFTGISGLPAEGGPIGFTWYPNPARDRVTVRQPHPGTAHLTLHDVTGRAVLRERLPAGEHELDVSGLASGVYVWRMADDGGRALGSGRLRVQR